MWSKLFNLILRFIGLFQVFFYVDQYDKAVVLRVGKYNRSVGPGFRWIIPLEVEKSINVNAVSEPMYIDNQSGHTSDGFLVNWQLGLIFKVTDAEKFLVRNETTDVQVNLIAAGAVLQAVESSTWQECRATDFLREVQKAVNRSLRSKGVCIGNLMFVDFASGEANRLWVDGIDIGDCYARN